MTDTEILRDVAERIAFAAQFQPSPEIAEEARARAAAIRRVIARVAELERENQTQRDIMQGKDDAIAELSFAVKELEEQVAALTADAKERQP